MRRDALLRVLSVAFVESHLNHWTLKCNQFEPAVHLRRDTVAMIKTSADWRDIGRAQSSRGGNEIIIAKDSVRRIQPPPPGARQKDFGPCRQRTFGATDLFVRFTQISRNNPRSQASIA